MDKKAIRAARLQRVRQLIDERYNGVDARFASAIGKAPTQVARWFMDDSKHQRNIGEDIARGIEKSLGLPAHWLDRPPTTDRSGDSREQVQLPLPEHLSEATAHQILTYASQLSVAQQKSLIESLREAVEANDLIKSTLKIERLDHPDDPRVAGALKSHSLLRTRKQHKKRRSPQRYLPLFGPPDSSPEDDE